jgi:hypothetical protein
MNFFTNPSRRKHLQSAAGAVAWLILPKSLRAGKPTMSFWFVPCGPSDSWPVADPVEWSLENARQPVLERASEGLLNTTALSRVPKAPRQFGEFDALRV